MEENIFPDELFKYRALNGVGRYRHIEDNIYEDTTCSHSGEHCRIAVKPVEDHWEFGCCVNDSAVEHKYIHEYSSGDSHYYTDVNTPVIKSFERHIKKDEEKIADCESKLSNMSEIETTPQRIENFDFEQEVFLIKKNTKDVIVNRIQNKVYGKNGLEYLITESERHIQNSENHDCLTGSFEYEDEYERIKEEYIGFDSIEARDAYYNNKTYRELVERKQSAQKSLDYLREELQKYKEKCGIV